MSVRAPRRLGARARRDDGTTLVEAVVGAGLFLVLVFGVLEMGSLMRDRLTATDVTRAGARRASTLGNDLLTDYAVIQAVTQSPAWSGRINYVVVFKAPSFDTPLSAVSATCQAGSPVAGVCNVYRPADFDRPSTDFGCSPTVPSPDRFWCPAGRKVGLTSGTNGPPDYVGVYLNVTHDYLTQLIADSSTIVEQTVMRIEPQEL